MIVKYKAQSLEPDVYPDAVFQVEQISHCPRCNGAIAPLYMGGSFKRYSCNYEKVARIEIYLFCPNCEHSFIGTYFANCTSGKYSDAAIKAVEPLVPVKQTFNSNIENLSPQFVEIYNQSLAAESYKLNEIAGLGYRKALEFLIKDFSIRFNPHDTETIKSMPLSSCIRKYIKDDSIQPLVEKAAWLGNDEAHYVRKHNDRDITDMKVFITAVVHFISLILTVEDAKSI